MTDTVPVAQGEIVEQAPAKPRKRNGDGRSLAKLEDAPPPAPVSEGGAMLALFERMARDPSIDPARIQEFLRMKRDEEDRQAQRAFNAAMAQAKAEFEPIVKRHLVGYDNKGGGKTSYKHEDLADIETAVKPSLSKHGLSYRFRGASKPNEPVSVTCIVTHEGGHFEETTLDAGADNSGGKNSIQGIGSTITYLQRYTLKLALGLAAGRDDDGNGAGNNNTKPTERITEGEATMLEASATRANIDHQVIREFFKVQAFADLTPEQFKLAMGRVHKKLKLEGRA
jgi:hypothetical protein